MAATERKDESSSAHTGTGHQHGGLPHEEHEGAPEWLISFADNVVLMMGFFVILLAMNMKEPTTGGIGGKEKMGGQPDSRMLDLIIGIREAFNNPIRLDSTDPAEAVFRRRILEKRQGGMSLQPEEPGAGRESQTIIPTERSGLGGVVPFDDDADALSPHALERAEQIARKVRGQRWIIEVRGHASPSETLRDPERGMALGYRRALAVARVLAGQGVRWEHMRVISCGANERQAPREYERHADRINQRVEVVVTGEPVREAP